MMRTQLIGRRTFIAGLAGLGASMFLPGRKAEALSFAPFSFAFISDCHLVTGVPDSFKLTQESQLFLQDAVKQVNSLAPDFLIFGGDQVDALGDDESNWQLFIDILQSLNCPWSFVLGERDVSGTMPVDKLKTYGRDWKGKGLTGDKSYWSQDLLPGVHVIGLDTSKANSVAGELSSEQLDWLQQDLNNNKRGIVIVVSHHPLLPPAPYDGGPPWDDYTIPSGASAREILNSSTNVRLAVSGHVYVSKVEREKDIWYVSSPALDVFPCAFRLFRVAGDGITVETYQIGYPALIKKARNTLAASSLALHYNDAHPADFLDLAEGDRLDQDVHLPFARGAAAEPIKHRNPPKQETVQPKEEKKEKGKKHKKEADKEKEEKGSGKKVKTDKEPDEKVPQAESEDAGASAAAKGQPHATEKESKKMKLPSFRGLFKKKEVQKPSE